MGSVVFNKHKTQRRCRKSEKVCECQIVKGLLLGSWVFSESLLLCLLSLVSKYNSGRLSITATLASWLSHVEQNTPVDTRSVEVSVSGSVITHLGLFQG